MREPSSRDLPTKYNPVASVAINRTPPLDGFVMEPMPEWETKAASIICGHAFVQQWPEEKMAEFEDFVREVLRTTKN